MITGATPVYAVVGDPVRHSRSPELHNAWLRQHGIDAVYVALPTPADRAGALGEALRTLGVAGANLTVPFKQAIVPSLDALGPVAAVLGAVNTVVRDGDRLVGHNTDADGYVDGLVDELGDVVTGARVVVLGAGGAGRAVGVGLARRGAARVTWLNRTVRVAEDVARLAAAHTAAAVGAAPLTPEAFGALAPETDLVVVATSGPGAAVVRGLDVRALPASAVWSDLNYWMADPPGLAACRARGLRVQGGLPMLVHQAARAFQLFFGVRPDARTALASLV